MLWKVYFWPLCILTVFGLFAYGTQSTWTVRDFIDVVWCVITIVGLYAYVYKKDIGTKAFWQWVFWISIAISLFDILYLYSGAFTLPAYLLSSSYDPSMKGWYMPALLLSVPLYYALYQLGYAPRKTAPKGTKATPKKKKK